MKLSHALSQHDKLRFISRAAFIAAVYAAFTYALAPISYLPVQFRVSEALTLLPTLMPEAIPGLFVGCLLANIIGSATVWDVVFGSLATLIAAALTYVTRRNRLIAAMWPALCNALIVGSVIAFTADLPLIITMGQVGIGEAAVVYTLGMALLSALGHVPAKYLTAAGHKK